MSSVIYLYKLKMKTLFTVQYSQQYINNFTLKLSTNILKDYAYHNYYSVVFKGILNLKSISLRLENGSQQL